MVTCGPNENFVVDYNQAGKQKQINSKFQTEQFNKMIPKSLLKKLVDLEA